MAHCAHLAIFGSTPLYAAGSAEIAWYNNALRTRLYRVVAHGLHQPCDRLCMGAVRRDIKDAHVDNFDAKNRDQKDGGTGQKCK
jgi:hypothetical protein